MSDTQHKTTNSKMSHNITITSLFVLVICSYKVIFLSKVASKMGKNFILKVTVCSRQYLSLGLSWFVLFSAVKSLI